MKKTNFLARLAGAFLAAALLTSCATPTPPPPPKLVVFMVVDGLPMRQVTAYRDQLAPDGLARFLDRGAVFADALLGAIADNGGPTRTFALQAGSPAIDAGTLTGAPANDQRGLPRFVAVDIGAFEVQAGAMFANGFE